MKLKRGWIKPIVLLPYSFVFFCALFIIFATSCKAEEGGIDRITQIDSHVVINEVYPYSDGSYMDDQGDAIRIFIELFNPTLAPIDLSVCTIEDKDITDKGKSAVSLNQFSIINSKGYSILTKENKGIGFTINYASPEMLTLKCNGEEVDKISFDLSKNRGKSISRIPNGVDMDSDSDLSVSIPTPGAENKKLETISDIEVVSEQGSETITEAREQENGEQVTISGAVTVTPDTLSSQYFYIQDQTGGIQIYSYYKNFPVLEKGDVIKLTGELSEMGGERRLKIDSANDIIILGHEDPPPPKQTEIKEVGEPLEGQYVKVSGTVKETSGAEFIVQDENGNESKVIIKSMTDIQKPRMRKGDRVEISGIVTQYKDEYRILPIEQDDVRIINSSSSNLPETGLCLWCCPILAFLIEILWNTFQKMKKKPLGSQEKFFFNLILATYTLSAVI